MRPARLLWDSTKYQAASANTQNRITTAASAGDQYWVTGGVWWSTSGGTPACTLTIETSPDSSNWTTVFSQDITVAGPGFFIPEGGPRAAGNAGGYVRYTLSAAGSGVSSKLWVDDWKENSRSPAY